MTRIAFFVVTLLISEVALSQTWPGYQPQLLRWSEDYSAQCAADSKSGLLLIKCIPLGRSVADYLSLGAEYRWRVDHYDPFNFGIHGEDDLSSVQNRILLNADFHFDDRFRVFTQLGAGSENGRPIRRPGDEGAADVIQAFADFNFTATNAKWRVRAGRQEVAIGRYVAIRDATNIRRTFDGLRADGSWNADTILAFAAQATRLRSGAWNDDSNPDDRIAALVWSHALFDRHDFKVDVAALDHDNHSAVYAAGLGHEDRRTLGLRFSGARGVFDIDAQASYQFGHFTPARGEMTISAWGAAFEGGATFKQLPWSPRFALRVDIAGGDRDARDATLNTFDIPYPNLSYLTDAAFFAPRNVWDIQPFATAAVLHDLTLTIGSQFLWRVTSHDAVYSSANLPIFPASTSGNYIATQPYLRLQWRPIALLAVQASLEKALLGEVARQAGAHDQTYGSIAITVDI